MSQSIETPKTIETQPDASTGWRSDATAAPDATRTRGSFEAGKTRASIDVTNDKPAYTQTTPVDTRGETVLPITVTSPESNGSLREHSPVVQPSNESSWGTALVLGEAGLLGLCYVVGQVLIPIPVVGGLIGMGIGVLAQGLVGGAIWGCRRSKESPDAEAQLNKQLAHVQVDSRDLATSGLAPDTQIEDAREDRITAGYNNVAKKHRSLLETAGVLSPTNCGRPPTAVNSPTADSSFQEALTIVQQISQRKPPRPQDNPNWERTPSNSISDAPATRRKTSGDINGAEALGAEARRLVEQNSNLLDDDAATDELVQSESNRSRAKSLAEDLNGMTILDIYHEENSQDDQSATHVANIDSMELSEIGRKLEQLVESTGK